LLCLLYFYMTFLKNKFDNDYKEKALSIIKEKADRYSTELCLWYTDEKTRANIEFILVEFFQRMFDDDSNGDTTEWKYQYV